MESYFAHHPLQFPAHQIRLLRINDVVDGIVSCSLYHCDFDASCPRFIAVSYRWGEEDSSGQLLVNGTSFPICDNLDAFFAATYTSLVGEYLWIDQISIDQRDIDEKNLQVKMMGRIFQTAYKVIAWVGRAYEDSCVAMEVIRTWPDSQTAYADKDSAATHGFDIYPQVQSVINFFKRDYWYRAWVIQELVLAHNITIHCGHLKVQWKKVEDMLYTMQLGRKITEWSLETPSRQHVPITFANLNVTILVEDILPFTVQDIVLDRRDFGYNKGRIPEHRTLGHVLASYPDLQCQKVHDKIYALQNLVQPRKRVPVDYRKSEEELLMDVLREVTRDTFRQVSSDRQHVTILPDATQLSQFAIKWHEFLGAYETDWNTISEIILWEFRREEVSGSSRRRRRRR
jgi:hypothetical protein